MKTIVNAPTITPSVQYRDARAGMGWLAEILDFRVAAVYDEPDGGVAHAQLVWRTGIIFVSSYREEGPFANTGPSMIALTAPDAETVDRYYERATAAGTDIVYPLSDEPYGSHEFSLRDPEGNLWTVGTYQPEIPAI